MKLFLQSIITTTASISIAGTLKNAVQSAPIDLNGTIYYQSCLATPDSNEIVIKAKSTNIECHVKFSSNDSQGKRICDLAKKNQIESATCAPSRVTNPAAMYFDFDGANFSYFKSSQESESAKCTDLEGEWELVRKIPNGGFNPKIIMRLTQDGCKGITVEYSASTMTVENLVKRGSSWVMTEVEVPHEEPIPSGIYVTDRTTSPSWDIKHYYTSSLSKQGFSVLSPYAASWTINPGITKEWSTETSTGWSMIEVANNHAGHSGSRFRFVKIKRPVKEGSCHNLRYSELPIGFICKTSSGFRWKKSMDGWVDLSPHGKSWTMPVRKQKISRVYGNETEMLKGYSKYCASFGKSPPKIPRLDQTPVQQDAFGLDRSQPFGSLDFNSSDAKIAFDREMKELFPELHYQVFLTGTRSLERDSIWGFEMAPIAAANISEVYSLIHDSAGFGWKGYTHMLICNGPASE